MVQMAERYNLSICGSYAVKIGGNRYNKFLWINPDKSTFQYDKIHLFAHGKEDETFTAGFKTELIPYKNFIIKPQICFDLRFPETARYTKEKPFDVLIYVASWPEKRIHHWESLLVARAIENQSYVIGVNRLGIDGHGLNHNGHSSIIDFNGNFLVKAEENEGYFSSQLSLDSLNNHRSRFKFF
jgi:predicted amidohydrolase